MTQLSRETILAARQKYLAGKPVKDICAEFKISRGTLYYWLHGGPGEDNKNRLPPIPLRYAARPAPTMRRKDRRKTVVQRVWRAAEQQAREIERRLAISGRGPDARERDARLLASLVKTLRDLCALDAAPAGDKTRNADNPDEADFDDIEEFRRALAERLERIVAERKATALEGDHAP